MYLPNINTDIILRDTIFSILRLCSFRRKSLFTKNASFFFDLNNMLVSGFSKILRPVISISLNFCIVELNGVN